MNNDDKTRILILGGGFAGVYTARYLEKMMTRAERERVEISIVSLENYIVFQPFLPEVISGTIETLHCITPIRRLTKRTILHTRTIEHIDLETKTVRLSPEYQPKPKYVQYDHLVVAMGTRLNYDLVPGMREHAIPFKYLGDALRLRNEAAGVLEEADSEEDPEEKKRLLTFVVGGGGFSGVECIAELNDFLHKSCRDYPNVDQSETRTILLQSGNRILPELGEGLAEYAQEILRKRGVEIRLNTRLKAVTADGALMQDRTTDTLDMIHARTVVATVPAAPHPLIADLPFATNRGRIPVTEFMSVDEWPGYWALGDCATVPQRDGINSPPTAQHALRQAKTCATNILASIRDTPTKPFLFTGLGKLASLGQQSAVAEVFGIKVSGIIAWVLWRTIYLMKFPGWDRKVRIGIDWALDLFLRRDITQVRIFQPESVLQEHFHSGEIIFERGDFGDKVYVIVKGEAEIIKGEDVTVVGPEYVFGERALVSDKEREITVRAKSPLDVISVSRQAFKQLVAHFPGIKESMQAIIESDAGHSVDLTKDVVD